MEKQRKTTYTGTKFVVAPKNFSTSKSNTGNKWINVGLLVVAPNEARGTWKNLNHCVVPGREERIREDFRRMGIEGDPITMTKETFQAPDQLCVVVERHDDFFGGLRITNVLGPPTEAYAAYLEKTGNDLSLPARKPDSDDGAF